MYLLQLCQPLTLHSSVMYLVWLLPLLSVSLSSLQVVNATLLFYRMILHDNGYFPSCLGLLLHSSSYLCSCQACARLHFLCVLTGTDLLTRQTRSHQLHRQHHRRTCMETQQYKHLVDGYLLTSRYDIRISRLFRAVNIALLFRIVPSIAASIECVTRADTLSTKMRAATFDVNKTAPANIRPAWSFSSTFLPSADHALPQYLSR